MTTTTLMMNRMASFLRRKSQQKNPLVPFLCGCLVTFLLTYLFGIVSSCSSSTSLASSTTPGASTKAIFKGTQYWKDGATQKVKTLYETAFARFQIHQVQLENGKTVDDWMWYDEANNINVLVELEPTSSSSAPTYLVMRQTKYGITGTTLAVVGGLIEEMELPVHAAKRELKEELGLKAAQWVPLGQYQAAANRGGGTTHTFLARKCTPIDPNKAYNSKGGLAIGESEHQDLVVLTREQLLEALLAGKFQEIKWTATVALSLLTTIS